MVSTLVLGLIAFVPPVAILYLAIGEHDEHFRHNAMFLVLLGGLGLGIAAGFVELILMTDPNTQFWVVLLAAPLVETMVKTMIVGLPRFRGNRETILLGGGTGIMLAGMLFMIYAQARPVRTADPSWQLLVTLISVSVGFALAHFVSGMEVGKGPAEGRVLGGFGKGFVQMLPAHVLLVLLGFNQQTNQVEPLLSYTDIEFGLLLLVYGAVLTYVRAPTLLRESLPKKERARLRRQARR